MILLCSHYYPKSLRIFAYSITVKFKLLLLNAMNVMMYLD